MSEFWISGSVENPANIRATIHVIQSCCWELDERPLLLSGRDVEPDLSMKTSDGFPFFRFSYWPI